MRSRLASLSDLLLSSVINVDLDDDDQGCLHFGSFMIFFDRHVDMTIMKYILHVVKLRIMYSAISNMYESQVQL